MHKSQFPTAILLLSLLLVPFAGAQVTSAEELAAIAAAPTDVFAPGAPHGDWTRMAEEQPFYPRAGSNCGSPTLSYVPGATGSCVVGPAGAGGAVSFAMPAAQTLTRASNLLAFHVQVTATCPQDVVTGIEPSIVVSISGMDFGTAQGTQSAQATIETDSPGTAAVYETTLQSTAGWPASLPAGTPLTMTISSTSVPCSVSLGSGTFLGIVAESASINAWPTEGAGAETPIRSLPHADKVTPSKRVLGLDVAYVSAWPCLNHFDENGDGTSECTVTPGSDLMQARWTSGDFEVRVRDLSDQSTFEPTASAPIRQAGDPQFTDLSLSTQAVEYSFAYTNELSEGGYRFEIISDAGGVAQTRILNIGGKGFEISSVDGQLHKVNPGEPTTFRVKALNIGTERDTITFSYTKTGAAWDVRLVNGAVTLEPNAEAEAIFRVIPPANAIAGQSLDIAVTAASSFPQEVPPQAMELRVELQSAVERGATIAGGPSALDVGPGDSIDISGLRLHNTGTRVGTYVISTAFTPAAPQWSAAATPPSRTVDAASVDDFAVHLTVPTTAIAGETRTLEIRATLLGETTPRATATVDLTVVFTPALDLSAYRPAIVVRDDDGGTTPDNDNDDDAIFRVAMGNPTSVNQEFRITAALSGGTTNCPLSAQWRAPDATGFVNFGTGANALTVTVPPQSTVDGFARVAIGTRANAGCVAGQTGTLTLTFTSTLEPAFRATQALTMTIVDGARNTGAHAPSLETGRAPGVGLLIDTNGIAVRDQGSYTPGVYRFYVINDGSEFDSFLVEVPPASRAGWTQSIAFVADATVAGTGSGGSCAPSPSGSTRVFRCNGVGVGDHMAFDLTVTPASNIPLGQTLDTPLIVTSLDDTQNKDNLAFRTRTVGQFDHASAALRGVTDVHPGRTGALPFVVQNVGTNNDQYTVSLTGGNADKWKARFATSLGASQQITVPARSDFVSYLLVEGTAAGERETFTIQVQSLATGAKTSFSFDARTVAATTGFVLSGDPDNNFLLPTRGAGNEIGVALRTTGVTDGTQVTFTADNDALPAGWTVEQRQKTGNIAGNAASATFSVIPPTGALGTSQVPLRVSATSSAGTTYVDLVLTLESEVGVEVRVVGPAARFVPPGGPSTWDLEIVNLGLGAETMNLAATPLPPGWVVDLGAPQVAIAPLSTVTRSIDVFVPATADPRANVTLTITASSATPPGASDQVTLFAIVGYREIDLAPTATRLTGAPEETLSFAVGVTNNGTLQDRISFTATVVTPGYQDKLTATVLPSTADLLSEQGRDVLVNVQLGGEVPQNVDVTVRLVATSLFSPTSTPVTQSVDLTVRVLRYEARDVDDDLVREYAVDRNEDTSDGFEEFRDSLAPGGRSSVAADLQRFLSSGTLSPIDGDGDGKRDHFIDHTGDGLPDAYWDPDGKHSMALTVVKDVDADNVADYFVDTSGDGTIDRLYNIRAGTWTRVLAFDIDGDGTQDYAVDKNNNGQVDSDETVLFSRGGVLVTVLKVDVDGDGRLDSVFDIDGDGRPDHFVRAGETEGRKITMRDVNGDGVLDWTYDSNGDGRADRYYDPAAQTGGHVIDTTQNFVDLVSRYWFVPALFLLVLVLFIVLVAVTRR